MRASYLMSGVATGLRRNASMTIALVLSTAIALFFLGGALLINKEISKTQEAYKDKINVSIYLCTETSNQSPGSPCKHKVTTAERVALQAKLNADPQITGVQYLNEAQATQIAKVIGIHNAMVVKGNVRAVRGSGTAGNQDLAAFESDPFAIAALNFQCVRVQK